MPTFTDEGIILRRVDYGEADRILTVMTRDHGKLGVIARGVRKPRARATAQTDIFMRSTMQLAQSRGDLQVLTQAAAVAPVVSSSDPVRLACAGACAELVDRALESGHPDETTYALLSQSLVDCLAGEGDPRSSLVWFVQRLLARLGYAPQLHACASCGRDLPERSASFAARAGGLLCSDCTRSVFTGIDCDVRTIKVLRVAAAGDRDLYARIRFEESLLRTLERVAEAEVEEHLGKQLRSFAMLHSLTRA